MPKIALLKIVPNFYYENYEGIITAISEWEEVTNEELSLLRDFYNKNGDYTIVEFVENQREKIDFAVKAQLEYARKDAERKEAEKKAKAEKALARKHKLDEKKKEEKKQLLEQLKKEFGEG